MASTGMPSRAESAKAMANTPHIPSGARACRTHAVYFARMCPIVFKGNLVYARQSLWKEEELREIEKPEEDTATNVPSFHPASSARAVPVPARLAAIQPPHWDCPADSESLSCPARRTPPGSKAQT